jgi:hypothetical protein
MLFEHSCHLTIVQGESSPDLLTLKPSIEAYDECEEDNMALME